MKNLLESALSIGRRLKIKLDKNTGFVHSMHTEIEMEDPKDVLAEGFRPAAGASNLGAVGYLRRRM